MRVEVVAFPIDTKGKAEHAVYSKMSQAEVNSVISLTSAWQGMNSMPYSRVRFIVTEEEAAR